MRSSSRFVVPPLACALLCASGSALAVDPAFAPARQLAAGTTPVEVVVADFDGDLELDIVTADAASPYLVTVRRKSGAPDEFAAAGFASNDFPLPGAPADLSVFDLDADELPDLVAVVGGELIVCRNLGGNAASGGDVEFDVQSPIGLAGGTLRFVQAADWDGDLLDDLVATGEKDGTGYLVVFLNLGDGTLAAPVTTPTSSSPYDLALGDLTGDDRPDVVFAGFGEFRLVAFANPADGSATAIGEWFGPVSSRPVGVAIGDVSGDGRNDIAYSGYGAFDATSTSLDVGMFPNIASSAGTTLDIGAGTTFSLDTVTGVPGTPIPSGIALADANGDGALDAILANELLSAISVLPVELEPGVDGYFSLLGKFDLPSSAAPWRVAVADLDDDGEMDIVSAHTGGNGVNVFLNLSDGPPPASLRPAPNLSVSAKTKRLPDGSHVLQGGKPFTFSCTSPEDPALVSIRMQSSLTRDDLGSFTDVPGGTMTFSAETQRWSVTTSDVNGGTRYFRTLTTDATGGGAAPAAGSGFGPFDITPGPARLRLTSTIAGPSAPSVTVHRGEILTITLDYRNEGDTAHGKAWLGGEIPEGCTLVAGSAGEGVQFGRLLLWGPLAIPALSQGTRTYQVQVGAELADGTRIAARLNGIGNVKKNKKTKKKQVVGFFAPTGELVLE